MINAGVRVDGLRQFRRALKQVDVELPVMLRTELKAIGDKVAERARAKVPVRTGRAAATVRSGVSGATAYVAEGKKRVPYLGWLDYGGVLKPTGNRHNTISRDRQPGGRYLYPTVEEMRPEITAAAVAAFEKVSRRAGLR